MMMKLDIRTTVQAKIATIIRDSLHIEAIMATTVPISADQTFPVE